MVNQFQKDLEKGKWVEMEVFNYLKNNYDENIELAPNKYFPDYDLISPTHHTRFEVKNQNDAIKFVVIETSINGRPTGINTSKANYWAIKCKDAIHIIDIRTLKDLIRPKRIKKYKIFGQDVEMKHLDIWDLKDSSVRIILPNQINTEENKWKP